MADKDAFGIPMKYKRKTEGESYFLSDGIVNRKGINGEYDGGRVIMEGNGGDIVHGDRDDFFQVTQNSKVRISMTTSAGYQSSKIVTDRESLSSRGFMMTAKDVGNFELSFSFVYSGGGGDKAFVFLSGRGGKHQTVRPCEGSSYKAGIKLRNPDQTFIAKEAFNQFFPTGTILTTANDAYTDIIGWEVYLKLCVYDVDANGIPTNDKSLTSRVRIELYGARETTKGSGVFKDCILLKSMTDWGGWGTGAEECGNVATDQIIKWNAPLVSIGWEGLPNIVFRRLSFEEIDLTDESDPIPVLGSQLPPADTTPTASTTEALNDSLGIKKIYKSKTGGSLFIHEPTKLLSNSQFSTNGASVTHLGNGIYQVKPGTTRILLFSTSSAKSRGNDYEDYPTYNFEKLRQRTSWDDTKTDFHNTEFTIYLEHISASNPDNDEFSLVTRSVRHEETSHNGCGGSSYHGNISLKGLFRFKKEQRHVDYDSKAFNSKGIGGITGKTIGLKFVNYDLPDKTVKLEMWADKDNKNIWSKYHEMIDKDDWGDAMTVCGALKKGASILWGSPKAIIKCNQQKFNMSKISLREITTELLTEAPPTSGGGGGTGSTGNTSRTSASFTFIWDNITDSSGFNCTGSAASGNVTYTEKYGVTAITNDVILANDSTHLFRTRCGILAHWSTSQLKAVKPTKIGFYIKKFGSPTGNAYIEVYDDVRPTPNIVAQLGLPINVATDLTTNYVEYLRIEPNIATALPNGLLKNYGVGVRYEGGDANNYVMVASNEDDPFDSNLTCAFTYIKADLITYDIATFIGRDMAGHIYKSP